MKEYVDNTESTDAVDSRDPNDEMERTDIALAKHKAVTTEKMPKTDAMEHAEPYVKREARVHGRTTTDWLVVGGTTTWMTGLGSELRTIGGLIVPSVSVRGMMDVDCFFYKIRWKGPLTDIALQWDRERQLARSIRNVYEWEMEEAFARSNAFPSSLRRIPSSPCLSPPASPASPASPHRTSVAGQV